MPAGPIQNLNWDRRHFDQFGCSESPGSDSRVELRPAPLPSFSRVRRAITRIAPIIDGMSDSNPSRREFITGRRETSPDEPEHDPSKPASVAEQAPDLRESAYIEHLSKRAMACQFEFIFNMGQFEDAADVAMLAFDEIERLETQMTIYRDWSELVHLNDHAAKEWVIVEARLFGLLLEAKRIWSETDGAFDITSTPLTRLWGFSKRAGRVPSQEEIETTLQTVGMQYVEFDEETRGVRFTRPDVSLNLGGIGKGFALDRCADILCEHGLHHVLIHGGQSSLIGRGARTGIGATGRKGWTVGLSHPVWPDNRIAEFQLVDRALGTSGTGRQSFYHRGKRYGHIIDPRNGAPAEGILSSTVIAPTAAEADALATAFYVAGLDFAMEYCKQRSDLGLVLVTQGARRGEVVIHSAGLSDDEWREVANQSTAPDESNESLEG